MLKIFLASLLITCALSYPDRNERIVGGRNAALGQVPFQASLRSWGTTFHFAGGVLISNRWVLTSAYNMVGRAQNSLNIALGIISLTATFTSRRSDIITIHPSFNSNTRQNDIACVRSSTVITFTQNIQPAFLVSNLVFDGTATQVSGWGATDIDKGPNSDILQVLNVVASPCVDSGDNRITTTNTNICAIVVTGFGGFCTSDVGGPLIIPSGLVGIASWHHSPCAFLPDVYVRISWYRSWIGSITGV